MTSNKTGTRLLAAAVMLLLPASIIIAQQPADHSNHADGKSHASCPLMKAKVQAESTSKIDTQHADHTAEMNRRGDDAMGFSQASTTHHFRLLRDGGAIEVEANDPSDIISRDHIRQHMAGITRAFADGDFAIPLKVHDQAPPGTDVMKRMKKAISYRYEETERGGRVRISTSKADALKAIHDFLRFQVKEHQTGDPLEVNNQ